MTLSTSRGRGLLLQRFGKLARARLHLVEQPHVLDRDHRLVGEGGHQLDLLVGERAHRRALQNDHADRRILPAAAGRRAWSERRRPSVPPGQRVFRIGQHIGNMNGPAFQHGASERLTRARRESDGAPCNALNSGGKTVARDLRVMLALRDG